MFDENKYPTLRYFRCKKCGNVFVMSYDGATECPDCESEQTDVYDPEKTEETHSKDS
jgi:uncharacterized Zn finger protein (UPF0148 family)